MSQAGLVKALDVLKRAKGKHRVRTSNATNDYNIATQTASALEDRGWADVIPITVQVIEYEVEITPEGLKALRRMMR